MTKSISLLVLTLTILLGFSSCKKKLAQIVHPEFVGKWSHIEHSNERWYIDVDSYGTVTLYDSLNDFITAYGENPKKWRVNKTLGTLKHGFDNVTFQIDAYPSLAENIIIHGMDTIEQGETYAVLDGDYFVNF